MANRTFSARGAATSAEAAWEERKKGRPRESFADERGQSQASQTRTQRISAARAPRSIRTTRNRSRCIDGTPKCLTIHPNLPDDLQTLAYAPRRAARRFHFQRKNSRLPAVFGSKRRCPWRRGMSPPPHRQTVGHRPHAPRPRPAFLRWKSSSNGLCNRPRRGNRRRGPCTGKRWNGLLAFPRAAARRWFRQPAQARPRRPSRHAMH